MSITDRGKKGKCNHFDNGQLHDENRKFCKRLKEKAAAGDIAFILSPAACERVAAATAFNRIVDITLQTKEGEVHSWYDGVLTVSIADTSTAGVASLPGGTSVTMNNGRAKVVVSGTAAEWAADETNTLTLEAKTIEGVSVASKTSVETITAAPEE